MLKNFFSSKKPKNEEKSMVITFYFVSGLSIDIECDQEKFDVLLKALAQGWNNVSTSSALLGINFALVTHYTVKNR